MERVFTAVVPAGRRFPVGCALRRVACSFPGLRTLRGSQVGAVVAPPPARLRWRDAPGSLRGWRPRDPRVAPHGWGEAGVMLGVWHWFFRLRSSLSSS